MASAAQPKRMVSSVFITLAPPYRATLTKPQHTLQTHQAPARDQQHPAVRVEPRGDVVRPASQRHRKGSSSSEDRPSGGKDPAPARAARGSESSPAVPHLGPAELCKEGRPEELCGFCRKTVGLAEPAIEALNRTYHDSCFQCRQCQIPLAGKLYYNKAGIPLCEDCYQVKYAPQCSACKQLIIPKEDGTDSYTVECQGNSYHEDCYRCEICAIQLSPEPNDHGCHPLDGKMLCKDCHLSL
ncbi:hypothetical protein CRUP_026436, partial [Coryphaenoides rupestris]